VEQLNEIECLYFGSYYHHIKLNKQKLKLFYGRAIKLGNSHAMNNLGHFYQYVEKDYANMKMNYDMAIENGNLYALAFLGIHYEMIDHDYTKAKNLYERAISSGCTSGLYNMACYYDNIEKNFDLMKKYHLMAIEQKYEESHYFHIHDNVIKDSQKRNHDFCKSWSMKNLGDHYRDVEDFQIMKIYYTRAIENGSLRALKNLLDYYKKNENDKTFMELLLLRTDHSVLSSKLMKNVTNFVCNNLSSAKNTNISRKYYELFCNLNLGDKVDPIIKYKQAILKMTGIYPKKYSENYILQFMILLSLSSDNRCSLPKDIILLIAGHLFT
jgi:TPR repeat protein